MDEAVLGSGQGREFLGGWLSGLEQEKRNTGWILLRFQLKDPIHPLSIHLLI